MHLANDLFLQGISVQPIIYPGVVENSARLRFFLSSAHTKEQINKTIKLVASLMTEKIQVGNTVTA